MDTTDLPSEAIADMQSIQKAGTMAFGPAGFAGTIPDATEAYWRLLQDPYGATVFRHVATSQNATARLYGLLGLYHLDRAAYFDIAEWYRQDRSGITYLRGCMATTYPLNGLLAQLETGHGEEDIFAIAPFDGDEAIP